MRKLAQILKTPKLPLSLIQDPNCALMASGPISGFLDTGPDWKTGHFTGFSGFQVRVWHEGMIPIPEWISGE